MHMVHGRQPSMRRFAVHIARHGQHAHCAQRASGYKFCCYAQYACRKYYSQRTQCLHIACHVHQLARAQQWHAPPAQWQARGMGFAMFGATVAEKFERIVKSWRRNRPNFNYPLEFLGSRCAKHSEPYTHFEALHCGFRMRCGSTKSASWLSRNGLWSAGC